MLSMIGYVLIIGILLSAAALSAEQAAKWRGLSKRWIWIVAMSASVLLPLIVPNVTIQVPSLLRYESTPAPIVLRKATSVHLPMELLDQRTMEQGMTPLRLQTLFHTVWLTISLALLGGLVVSALIVYRRRRLWTRTSLLGTPVLVAPDVGPAVIGLLRPCIVIPAWLQQESITRQQYVLAHEQSHLDARDPQMLSFALCLLVAMPWNVLLWWQIHRLRRAIEIDCDARVLRHGSSASDYCDTLIQVGQNQSRSIGAVAAMSESGSFLEQRIRIMLIKPGKWARLSALTLIGASLGMAAFATQVTPPETAGDSAPQEVTVNPAILARYVGTYRFGAYAVMTVKLDGTQLSTQLTGQPFVPIFPSSDTAFFAKLVKVRLDFLVDAKGQATTMEFYQNGQHITAARIDAAEAQRVLDDLKARVSAQQPFPHSEQILQVVLAQNPDAPQWSPTMANAIRKQQSRAQDFLGKLGPATSHEFIGVTPQGWDKYLVRHENGTEEVAFAVDANGTIVGAFRRP